MTIPTKQLYMRQNIESELVTAANQKKFEKYDPSKYITKWAKEEQLDDKQKEKKAKKKEGHHIDKKEKHSNKRPINELMKVKIDCVDPNSVDLEQLY